MRGGALAKPDGGQEVDGAHRDILMDLGRLHQNARGRVIRDKLLERGHLAGLLGTGAHDGDDSHGGGATLAGLGRLRQHLDLLAATQAMAFHQGRGHVGAFGIKAVAVVPMNHEALTGVV